MLRKRSDIVPGSRVFQYKQIVGSRVWHEVFEQIGNTHLKNSDISLMRSGISKG